MYIYEGEYTYSTINYTKNMVFSEMIVVQNNCILAPKSILNPHSCMSIRGDNIKNMI